MTDANSESLLFRGKYRIPAARLTTWDYAMPGHYFVTICTDDRFPWFGHVEHQRMCVNDIGGIVDACWRDIPNHFDNVTSDAFVIMPDHVHGIVVIHPKTNHDDAVVETPRVETPSNSFMNNEMNGRVETPYRASLRERRNDTATNHNGNPHHWD